MGDIPDCKGRCVPNAISNQCEENPDFNVGYLILVRRREDGKIYLRGDGGTVLSELHRLSMIKLISPA